MLPNSVTLEYLSKDAVVGMCSPKIPQGSPTTVVSFRSYGVDSTGIVHFLRMIYWVLRSLCFYAW